MKKTDKLGLTVIGETDDMLVSDFFRLLSGDGADSNMEILEESISVLTNNLDGIDPDGSIRNKGGIAAWIAETYENAEVNSY